MNRKVCRDNGEAKLEKIIEDVDIFYGHVSIRDEGTFSEPVVKDGVMQIMTTFNNREDYLYAKDYNEALRSLDSSYEELFQEAMEA